MKKIIAVLLCLAMVLGLAACAQKQGGGDTTPSGGDTTPPKEHEEIKLILSHQATDETVANVLRDQISKAKGLEVELKAYPDLASLAEAQRNGSGDMYIFSWGNAVGTPDYAVGSVWVTGEAYNRFGYSNPEVDKLIKQAGTEPLSSNMATYLKAESIYLDEDCAGYGLYCDQTNLPYSPIMEDGHFATNSKIQDRRYKDASLNETRTFNSAQQMYSFTSFDPPRANDRSSGTASGASYIKLLSLDANWKPMTRWGLARNFATAEDCQNFYFILRDDCFFSTVDKNQVQHVTNNRVGGEDVVFSLLRCADSKSTPTQSVYSLFNTIDAVEIVTDLSELESVKAETGKTIRQEMEAGITPISELVAAKTDVDNAAGKYQVVKVHTSVKFPQILNAIAHSGAGIVDAAWVAEVNKDFNFDTYDANKDRVYGDAIYCMKGANYDNDVHYSGAYVILYYDDYGMYFERNEGYCTKSDSHEQAYIKNWCSKFITDADAQLSALRAGELDFVGAMPATKWAIAESDPNCVPNVYPGTRVYMLVFNMHGNSEYANDVNLRKAVCCCLQYEAINAVLDGHTERARSLLSVCWDDAPKTSNYKADQYQGFMDAYWAAHE